MERYDLHVGRGEFFRQSLVFKDGDGNVIDLTGYTGYCQVRPEPESDELIVAMDVSITPSEGKVVLTIPDEVTVTIPAGNYAYDFAMEDGAGRMLYYLGGRFDVLPTVTKVAD